MRNPCTKAHIFRVDASNCPWCTITNQQAEIERWRDLATDRLSRLKDCVEQIYANDALISKYEKALKTLEDAEGYFGEVARNALNGVKQ